jgi:tetratricopeptide (TPR) repeat protein
VKRLFLLAAILCLVVPVLAQHHAPEQQLKAMLIVGVGEANFPVSTKNPDAQKFFDQGVAFLYGFNHDEAALSFRRAAELDPDLAMAWWGVALVNGANYNVPSEPEREKAAYEALQKATALAPKATESERAYIEALSARYSGDPNADLPKQAVAYSQAMKKLSQRYPDDLHAATLYAESLMNLRPWALWNADGTPAPDTLEIVSVLESVINRNPRHIGANHYYIHATEASRSPERALPSAHRLGGLAPASGHLVHMPAHVYIRTGDYADAAKANVDAADADRAYIKRTRAKTGYTMMLYPHNMHFEAVSHTMTGDLAAALKVTDLLEKEVGPNVASMDMLQAFMVTRPFILVRFQKWDDVLKLQAPPDSRAYEQTMWHYARGMAFANKGNIKSAEQELAAVKAMQPKLKDWASGYMQNPGENVRIVAEHVIAGHIARAQGDLVGAERELREAVRLEDTLKYNEPPDWTIPVRESLGAVLLSQKKYAEAEQVYRDDLARNRRNGRSLYGLAQALKGQQKDHDARSVEQQFQLAWKGDSSSLQYASAVAATN